MMKNKLLQIIILIGFCNYLYAQAQHSYIPLHLDLGTCWNYTRIVYSSTPDHPRFLDANTRIEKDTIINNLTYYIAEKVVVQKLPYNPTPLTYFRRYLLRNDTINKKVYEYAYNQDSLLYDFNLGIGDTIPRTDMVIDTAGIDTVYGVARKFYGLKTIFYHDNKPTILFYEGIGENRSNFDVFIPYYDANFNGGFAWIYANSMTCAFANKPLFGDSIASINCFALAIDNYGTDNLNFILFPNPTNGLLNIPNSQNAEISICLFNFYGKRIMLQTSKSPVISIDMETLPNGIYLIQIDSKNKKIFKKVLKL